MFQTFKSFNTFKLFNEPISLGRLERFELLERFEPDALQFQRAGRKQLLNPELFLGQPLLK